MLNGSGGILGFYLKLEVRTGVYVFFFNSLFGGRGRIVYCPWLSREERNHEVYGGLWIDLGSYGHLA
jgi:hypothetical protein